MGEDVNGGVHVDGGNVHTMGEDVDRGNVPMMGGGVDGDNVPTLGGIENGGNIPGGVDGVNVPTMGGSVDGGNVPGTGGGVEGDNVSPAMGGVVSNPAPPLRSIRLWRDDVNVHARPIPFRGGERIAHGWGRGDRDIQEWSDVRLHLPRSRHHTHPHH